MEIWKTVVLEGLEKYEISNIGRIKNKKTNRILRVCRHKTGHEFIRLLTNGKKSNYYIHRLVLLSFTEEKDLTKIVNHINNNASDNRLENLEWVTICQNANRNKTNKHRNRIITELYYSRTWQSVEEFYKTIMKEVY